MSEKKRISWWIWGSAALVMLLVAYVLSVGPLLALASNSHAQSLFQSLGPYGEDGVIYVLSLFCWPLEQLSETFPDSVGTVVQAYVDWWMPSVSHGVSIPASAPLPTPPIPPPPIVESL